MKKLLLIIITVVLFFGLWSCSQYDESRNWHGYAYEIAFQVPISWKVELGENDFSAFSDWPKDRKINNSFSVTFQENVELKEATVNLLYCLEKARKKDSGMGDLKESSAIIANMPAKKIEYPQELEGKKGVVKIILLQTEEGVVEITFFSSSKAGIEDFDKVVDSIAKDTGEE